MKMVVKSRLHNSALYMTLPNLSFLILLCQMFLSLGQLWRLQFHFCSRLAVHFYYVKHTVVLLKANCGTCVHAYLLVTLM